VFWVNYLDDNMQTFALNFSRPGAQVIAQYDNFLRPGLDGYARVHGYARGVATRLSAEIEALGPFELITRGDELPVFAFKLADHVEHYTVFDVSIAVRARGWQLPGLHVPVAPRRPRGAPRGRASRVQRRPRGHDARQPYARPGGARRTGEADPYERDRERLPPLGPPREGLEARR
jgi:hypothetical protein